MFNDVNYCTDDNLIYEPQDEILEWIEWDDLENACVDNLGFCYKSFQDIKEDFAIYWEDNPKLNRYYLLLL